LVEQQLDGFVLGMPSQQPALTAGRWLLDVVHAANGFGEHAPEPYQAGVGGPELVQLD